MCFLLIVKVCVENCGFVGQSVYGSICLELINFTFAWETNRKPNAQFSYWTRDDYTLNNYLKKKLINDLVGHTKKIKI